MRRITNGCVHSHVLKVMRHTPKIAKEKQLQTMVGAWIGDDKTQNEKEIKALIKLGKSGFVDIAVVGNETLMRGELSEEELTCLHKQSKKSIT